MSISRRNFNRQCLNFISKCKNLDEEWSVSKFHRGKLIEIDETNMNCLDDEQLVLMKTHIEINDHTKDIQTYEYSVVYSESYEVPVMYFCSSNQGGEPLKLENIILFSPKIQKQETRQTISQVEHPLLFRPFYLVHPCKTRNFMEIHKTSSPNNYLLTWLSVLGTLLDLKLDLRLANKNE